MAIVSVWLGEEHNFNPSKPRGHGVTTMATIAGLDAALSVGSGCPRAAAHTTVWDTRPPESVINP